MNIVRDNVFEIAKADIFMMKSKSACYEVVILRSITEELCKLHKITRVNTEVPYIIPGSEEWEKLRNILSVLGLLKGEK